MKDKIKNLILDQVVIRGVVKALIIVEIAEFIGDSPHIEHLADYFSELVQEGKIIEVGYTQRGTEHGRLLYFPAGTVFTLPEKFVEKKNEDVSS